MAQKMKFSINNFFSKCDQICSFLGIWSHLLKKSFMKNFIFCAVILCICFVTESNPMLLLKRTFNLALQVVLMIHPTHKMGCCELWYFVVLGDIETVMEIQDLLLIHSWDSSSWQV